MDSRTKASAKYIKNNVKRIVLNLNINTDHDMIEYMESIENKQGYLKSLIRKDMEEKRMKKFSIEDLQAWNEEQEREDTLFTVEHHFYSKGINGNLIERDNDCCFAQTNNFDEAMERFNYCKRAYANKLVEVKLMRASQVYAGNLEYEEIESYSNLK